MAGHVARMGGGVEQRLKWILRKLDGTGVHVLDCSDSE